MKSAVWLSPLGLVALTGDVSAHAMLEKAQPAAGAVVHGSPSTLRLEFSAPLEPAFSTVTVTDSAGHAVTRSALVVSQSTMSVPLEPLRAGQYRVSWHAVSVDTHRTQGSYTFTVSP